MKKYDPIKKTETELIYKDKNFRTLFDYMNEGVCIHKIIYDDNEKPLDYEILDVNPAYEKMLGIKKKDAQNQSASELYGIEEPPYLEVYSRVANTGTPETFEIYWPPLKKHFLISVFSPLKKYFATIFTDITELKENELQLDAIYQNVPFIMMLVDHNQTIRRINNFALNFSKRTESEVIGIKGGDALRCVNSLEKEEGCGFGEYCARCTIRKNVVDTLETGNSHYLEQAHLPFIIDGEQHELTFLLSTTKIEIKGESLALVTIQDITKLKKAESELSKLGSAIQQAYDGVVITDPTGAIEYVNPSFETLTGYAAEDIIGRNPRFLKSGKQDDSFYKNLWETITRGEQWKGIIVNKRKNGSFYTAECSISPVFTPEGEISSFVWITRDISEQLEIQKRLNQAQKMETIGTLAGGIAHDFNNILSPIVMHTEMLMDDIPRDDINYESLEQVYISAIRAKDLVQQILTFSRQTKHELHPLKVGLIIKEVMKLLRSTVPTTIDLKYNFQTQSDTVYADPVQIHQLIMNLCTNSVHAMKENGGELVVTLSDVELTKDLLKSHHLLKPNLSYLKIKVEDNGDGINDAIKEKIFDPFFTTKQKGEGTGMGLSVVHGIIESYGGSISVDSDHGKGTTFEIFLPRVKIEAAEEELEIEDIPPGGNERILLVDDEEILADAVSKMLKKLGYQVTSSASSLKALEIFKRNPNSFDLVITDMTMPGMRGDQLALEIMNIRKDMPIIICTGFSEKINEKTVKKMGLSALIMKPIVRSQMAKTIREVLDKR